MALAIREQLRTLARYNVWATRRLLSACDALTDDEYRRDVGLFFKSVHGTLNHMALAEHDVWYVRVHDRENPLGIELSREVERDRAQLKQAMVTKAERWLPLLEALDDETLTSDFAFASLSGVPQTVSFQGMMMHVLNHGTHHRGQVTAALTMLGHETPVLDLVYMLLVEQPQSAA